MRAARSDPQPPRSVWVRRAGNAVRALFRPALTVLLWAIGAWVFYLVVGGALIDWLKAVDIADLIRYMVFSVFFSASTATVWLFSDHALTPPAMKNR